jgi:DNA-directed RNA polymerase subunit L
MNSIEEYKNVVELLKQALKFYAEMGNYDAKHPINGTLFSPIEMDNGAQARFALNKLEELEKLSQNWEDEFMKNVTNAIENNEPVDNVLKMIEDFKNLTSEDNNVENF